MRPAEPTPYAHGTRINPTRSTPSPPMCPALILIFVSTSSFVASASVLIPNRGQLASKDLAWRSASLPGLSPETD